MAFIANVANPETGHILKKEEVYIKVVSTGSGKEPIVVRNEDGTEKYDEYGRVVQDYGWVLGFRFFVFLSRTHKMFFDGSGRIENYDPEKPCEQQIYECVKQMKWQYWSDETLYDGNFGGEIGLEFENAKQIINGKVWYPLFMDIENT